MSHDICDMCLESYQELEFGRDRLKAELNIWAKSHAEEFERANLWKQKAEKFAAACRNHFSINQLQEALTEFEKDK